VELCCAGPLTTSDALPILLNMEIHLHPDLEAKLNRLAAENNSGAEAYVQQLLEHYVDHDAWFRQQVKKGLDQLDRGESLSHKEVGARIEQMLRP
jgi:predicted transcriptional regulator